MRKIWNFTGGELRGLGTYWAILYLLLLPVTAGFIFLMKSFNPATVVFLIAAIPSYTLLYMLPGMLTTGVAVLLLAKFDRFRRRGAVVLGVAAFCGFLTQLLLLADLGLYRSFDFHFNPLVWNLLTTPGGFESMGLRAGTVLTLSAAIALVLLFHAGIAFFCRRSEKLRRFGGLFGGWKLPVILAGFGGAFLFASLLYGYEHYMLKPEVLEASGRIPLFCPLTMSDALQKLGVKAPKATVLRLSGGKGRSLNYPLAPVKRDEARKKYNVLWLVGESWRADALNPEVMPETWKKARNGVRFAKHYSGGNGTRVGMFTMFYSLYGSYWHEFLKRGRGPLFMDWLADDNYVFKCLTSAKFSYPEFDRTIFSRVPAGDMLSDDSGVTWSRDRRNIERLNGFLRSADPRKPFMAFLFFESPHAPYEFPPESVVYPDYAQKLNYALLSSSEGPAIKKRYMNSCRHLDQCLAQVFRTLDEKKLWDNTIVVLSGDHGEEFFEKAHLGHNSSFVEEQIRTPLVLWIPGVSPRIYSGVSSHFDVVPTLAPFFGVRNPPADFSLGLNLFDPAQRRDYTVVADWSRLAFVSPEYKTVLPSGAAGFATQKLTDGDDVPRSDRDQFYRKNDKRLFDIQRNSVRFNN